MGGNELLYYVLAAVVDEKDKEHADADNTKAAPGS
jgi:hypothetical protein